MEEAWTLEGQVLCTETDEFNIAKVEVVSIGANSGALRIGKEIIGLPGRLIVDFADLKKKQDFRPIRGGKWSVTQLQEMIRSWKEIASKSTLPSAPKRPKIDTHEQWSGHVERLESIEWVPKFRFEAGIVRDDFDGPVLWKGKVVEFDVIRSVVMEMRREPGAMPMSDGHESVHEKARGPETLVEYLEIIKMFDEEASTVSNWPSLTPNVPRQDVDRFIAEMKAGQHCVLYKQQLVCDIYDVLTSFGIASPHSK